MDKTQRIRALRKLAGNLLKTLHDGNLTGFDAGAMLALVDEAQSELAELEGVLVKVNIAEAVVRALDELLDTEELRQVPHEAHAVILRKKHSIEQTMGAMEKQLSRVKEVEGQLIKNGVMIEIGAEAMRQGCQNAYVAALLAGRGTNAELQQAGTLKLTFIDEHGSRLHSKEGIPLTIEDAIKKVAGDNPNLFGADTGRRSSGNNPWLPDYFNLTRQGEITKKDPALAKRLQDEAKKVGTGNTMGQGVNPFMRGPGFNLTRQGEMLRNDPGLARRMATEAGVILD